MIGLGIETSCDELGIALIDWKQSKAWHVLRSQIDLHKVYGGVVPEIAARDHVEHMPKLLSHLLKASGVDKSQINHIGYTAGPGLIGALLTGAVFGCSFAQALKIPAIPIHHLEAHILMGLMGQTYQLPLMVLLVSGGHTQLLCMHDYGRYELIGQSLDDAAGEAFDKVAKKMGLGYPGGPIIEKIAMVAGGSKPELPFPLRHQKEFNFSFSGLKTATVQAWEQSNKMPEDQYAIAASFQARVIDSLCDVIKRAKQKIQCKQIVIAGGVSANQALRQAINDRVGLTLLAPRLDLCTDNGLMSAYTAGLRAHLKHSHLPAPQSRWDITHLESFSVKGCIKSLDVISV
tara:strand:+ start:10748 stop:11785 length:1038 start_codon:yes stop_codon:yes gene_type:complete